MKSRQHRLSLINILIPLLVLLPAAWALLPAGLPNTADGPVHFIRAVGRVRPESSVGQGISCPRCGEKLEIVSLEPPELDWAYFRPAQTISEGRS